jgi:hypothetical protein
VQNAYSFKNLLFTILIMGIRSVFFQAFVLICLIPAVASAQQKGEDDPFKNDPLFTKPLDAFFNKEQADSSEFSAKKRVRTANEEGLDFDDLLEAGPYNSSPLYGLYPNLPMIHFNRVDALFLGIREERMQWQEESEFLGIPNIHPHGMIGYSTGLSEWQYALGLEKFIGKKKHVILGTEYHNATSTDDYWRAGLNETSLTSFLAGHDYLDYYKQRGWGTYLLFRTNRLFEGGIAYSTDRFSSLQMQTEWALFGSGGRLRPNPPVEQTNGVREDTLDISSIALSASFNPKRLLLSPAVSFSTTGTVEFGDPGIGVSDYSYTKYVAEAVTHINFEPGSVLKYRLRAGSITGDAPSMKEFQLGAVGSLRALPYKALPSGRLGDNQMLLSNAEVQFGAPQFGDSDWIDSDDFYISIFLDSGWTSHSSDLENSNSPFTGFSDFRFSDLEHSGGFGLGSGLIRGELAWDLRNTSRAPVFWLRFNPTF